MLTEEELEELSGGLMEGYVLFERLKAAAAAPGDGALPVVDAFARALGRVHDKQVRTTMVVTEEDLHAVRDLRAMVVDWNRTGIRPHDLVTMADRLLALERT